MCPGQKEENEEGTLFPFSRAQYQVALLLSWLIDWPDEE